MTVKASFQPKYGSGITETATTSSTAYIIDTSFETAGGGCKSVVVSNQGNTNGVYVRVGATSAVTATDADHYIFPGSKETLTKNMSDRYIAIIAAASTSAVHVIIGEGF